MGRPAAKRPRLLAGRRARHQRGAAGRARPHHAGDARPARHRERPAVQSRRAANGDPGASLKRRRIDGARQRLRQALPGLDHLARQTLGIFALPKGDGPGSSDAHPARRARLMVLRGRRRDSRHDGATVGAGQVYLEASKDGAGDWLEGNKTYMLHVPKDAPVAQFWSFTVYDNETRCFVDTGSYPDRSSRDDIVTNADGSTDLYFGPTPPAGKPEHNWIKTIPGRGWFTYFRLYGQPSLISTRPGNCRTLR